MRRKPFRSVAAVFALLTTAACGAPAFTGFDPPSGPPRALVRVLVSDGSVVSAIWDAGEADERPIPVSLQGPWISIPADAEGGTHPVRLTYWGGQTEAIDFTVTTDMALELEHPRIDHVMPLDMEFNAAGQAHFLLYVQGANLEVGSIVEINGDPVPTLAHKAMHNTWYGVDQSAFEYPIHQYVSLVAVPGERAPLDELSIVVRNPDNVPSPVAVTYTVPDSLTGLDSDGDSLSDEFETNGHDVDGDGASDTDVYRRDIFVELDVMDGVSYPPVAGSPAKPGTVEAVTAMFATAPFLNPYGPSGIHLAFSLGGTVCEIETVTFDIDQPADTTEPGCQGASATFSQLKNKYFDRKADGDVYHYVIWAKRMVGNDTGMSDMPLGAVVQAGDDAIVAIGVDQTYHSERTRAEVLAHELGHNLAQRHGGANHEQMYNPNYWSVMSYTWVLRTDVSDNERMWSVTCLPFYYAEANATEPDYQVPMKVGMVLNFSAGMAKAVVENNNSLDELTGVCGHEANWNEDNIPNSRNPVVATALSVDANDNDVPGETIEDFANWPALLFDGPKRNGRLDH